MAWVAARTDKNHREIVLRLRDLGATVQNLHGVHGGCPDLVVGLDRVTHLVEIKDGDKPPSKRRLTPHQRIWIQKWAGSPVVVLLSAEDATAWVARLRGAS
jgi:hypothetical protein